MSFFSSLGISASGMTAERLRMDVVADNLANVNTTRTAAGGPFRRRRVIFEERTANQAAPATFGAALRRAAGRADFSDMGLNGVAVARVDEDPSAPRRVYDPGHPDAKPDGYVEMPNIATVTEMVDMMSATRAYEANVAAVQAAKHMALKALEIGRG
jgi:flagellar basal-body rod protein FlgC